MITVQHPHYPLLSPDGDGRRDSFRVAYTLNEPAHAILAVRGRRSCSTPTGRRRRGELVWNGRVKNSQGQLVKAKPGRYLLTISAQDRAANVSKGFPFAIAQVRYLTLARKRVVVRPGGKFALRVSTDAPRVNWRLHGRSGVQRSRDAALPRAEVDRASSSSTCSRPATRRSAWWSSHERRRRTGRAARSARSGSRC